MRTIEIPPSRTEPREGPTLPPGGLTLDLEALDRSEDDVASGSPVAPPVAADPSAEQLALEAIATAEAAKLRSANSAQLAASKAQLDKINADQNAQQERLAKYREEAAAHATAMAEYGAQLNAARADRERFAAGVAACRAGDHMRCGPGDGRR
ncbi:hypothetical protein [Sphingomonas sp.]|jgi:septal ring factor EnvC (AmiA/AmiB activator)|uniref:hypothetical protein n=1 Tax=Sphingomonas sp. TaxID=28214 RepID=UPI002610ED64|nr:hypothetical protein [Sphingomonas sp.]MDF2495333.1 hypothetical protein [Sphingomonas sp.]